jgi:hypothetical protein
MTPRALITLTTSLAHPYSYRAHRQGPERHTCGQTKNLLRRWRCQRGINQHRMGKNLRLTLYERLAGSGAIRPGRGRALGVFPTRTWPAQDAQHEQQVRQLVTQALVQQTAPDGRTAALIALLHALRCEHKIIDPQPYHLSRRQLSARAAEIAERNWASEAVRRVIRDMNSGGAGVG